MSRAPTIDADLLALARSDPRSRTATGPAVDDDLLSLARATPSERQAGAILRSVTQAPAPRGAFTTADRLRGRTAPPGTPLPELNTGPRMVMLDENTATTDPAVVAFQDLIQDTAKAVTDEEVSSFTQLYPTMADKPLGQVRLAIAERKIGGSQGFMHAAPEGPSGWAGYKRGLANELARFAPPIGGRLGDWKSRQMQEQDARGLGGFLGTSTGAALESLPALATGGAGAIPAMAPMVAGAANQKLQQNLDAGVSPTKSAASALGAGALELASEYIPLGRVRGLGDQAAEALGGLILRKDWKGVGAFLKNMAGVGNIEGLEEVASTVGENALDAGLGIQSWDDARRNIQSQAPKAYAGGFAAGALLEGPAYVGGRLLTRERAIDIGDESGSPTRGQAGDAMGQGPEDAGPSLFDIEEEIAPVIRTMEENEAWAARQADKASEKDAQIASAYGEHKQQLLRESEQRAWNERLLERKASAAAARGRATERDWGSRAPILESYRDYGLRDRAQGNKSVQAGIADPVGRAFYNAGYAGKAAPEEPAMPSAPAPAFKSKRAAYDAGYQLGQAGEPIEGLPTDPTHSDAYQQGYANAIEEAAGLRQPDPYRQPKAPTAPPPVRIPGGVQVPQPTSLEDLTGASMLTPPPPPATVAGLLASRAGTTQGQPGAKAVTTPAQAPDDEPTDEGGGRPSLEEFRQHSAQLDRLASVEKWATQAESGKLTQAKADKTRKGALFHLNIVEEAIADGEERYGAEAFADIRERMASVRQRLTQQGPAAEPEVNQDDVDATREELVNRARALADLGAMRVEAVQMQDDKRKKAAEKAIAKDRELLDAMLGEAEMAFGEKIADQLRAEVEKALVPETKEDRDARLLREWDEGIPKDFEPGKPYDSIGADEPGGGYDPGHQFFYLNGGTPPSLGEIREQAAKLAEERGASLLPQDLKKGPKRLADMQERVQKLAEQMREDADAYTQLWREGPRTSLLSDYTKTYGRHGRSPLQVWSEAVAIKHNHVLYAASRMEALNAEIERVKKGEAPTEAPKPSELGPNPTYEQWVARVRFYRSGKSKNAELPDGQRVILGDESTAGNFREKSRAFLEKLYAKKYPKKPEPPAEDKGDDQDDGGAPAPAPKPPKNPLPGSAAERHRKELIEQIVQAAESEYPVHTIEERFELKGTDGKWYQANGFPIGVKSTGERRSIGFGLTSKDGTHVGQLKATREEQEAHLASVKKERQDDFRSSLEKMDPEQLASQADYWIAKRGGPPSPEQNARDEATIAAVRKVLLDQVRNGGPKEKQLASTWIADFVGDRGSVLVGKLDELQAMAEKQNRTGKGWLASSADFLIALREARKLLRPPQASGPSGTAPGFKGSTPDLEPEAKKQAAEYYDLYDEGDDKISTVADLVNHINLIDPEDGVPAKVREAIEAWNTERDEDAKLSGRGDMEAADEAFLSVLRQWIGQEAAPAPKHPLKKPPAEPEPAKAPEPAKGAGFHPAFANADDGGDPKVRGSIILAGKIGSELQKGKLTKKVLFELADEAFGGTQAEGKYDSRDVWDAIELSVNRQVVRTGKLVWLSDNPDGWRIETTLEGMGKTEALIPTPHRRTAEQEEFQQFSTPLSYAAAVAYAANVRPEDRVLEPSAGVGSLAAWASLAKPQAMYVNELSPRRLALLKALDLPNVQVFSENAEQLDNILPDDVQPTVVVMNPPFSSTAGRMQGKRDQTIAGVHIEQALARLAPGGRLVAIVGRGMAMDAPSHAAWWKKIGAKYAVRANVAVSGDVYAKSGTTFATRLLVIDKVAPTGAEPVGGEVPSILELVKAIKEVRHGREAVGERGPEGAGVPGTAPGVGEAGGPEQGLQPPARGGGPGRGGKAKSGGSARAGAGSRGGARVGPKGPGRTGGERAGGPDRGGSEPETGGVNPDRGAGVDTRGAPVALRYKLLKPGEQDSTSVGIYESYVPRRIRIEGAQPHPSPLVESAAMAAVSPPAPTYQPKLPMWVVASGALSEAQLEAVVYAGQAHSDTLPDGRRKGHFVGDGTGVGKGRTISAIMLDNWAQGRKKHVWISENRRLLKDARRDWQDVGGKPDQVLDFGDTSVGEKIDAKEGVMFVGYSTLAKKVKRLDANGKQTEITRLDQLVEWLGKDFDGVIAFDEAHNLGNALDSGQGMRKKEASQKALAGIQLQERLPNARVEYVSATGATDINNYAYLERLGIWGQGTPFARQREFIAQITQGGVAAMELVARDMKQMGLYIARSISFRDPQNRPNMSVEYSSLEHQLNPDQLAIYDELAKAWQVVLRNFNAALGITGGKKNGMAKMAARSAFWSTNQRFFNQVITSMKMPTVIKAVERDIAAGKAVVLQITNTREADLKRSLAKLEEGQPLDELDLTPRDQLIDMVRRAFPTQQYTEVMDENGNKRSVAVTDSKGNPVENKEAVRLREQTIQNLKDIRVPEGPLDMLLNHFGPNKVAEATGRSRRVYRVRQPDGSSKLVEESWSSTHTKADQQAFQDGKKPILIFSQAGGTGASYHADRRAKNQNRRAHYLVQAGWQADKAIQGLGRTHRSNQSSAPIYSLVTTNLKGERRFIATIARRLDQLGALTKGQRETGGQGMFREEDNLESRYAEDALAWLWRDFGTNSVKGMDAATFEEQTGLELRDGQGRLKDPPEVRQFLNRLLSLTHAEQNQLFDQFSDRLRMVVTTAIAQGRYDRGIEQLDADVIEKLGDRVAWTDPKTGAETRVVQLSLRYRNKPTSFAAVSAKGRTFAVNIRSGKVWAISENTINTTDKYGAITQTRFVEGPISDRTLDVKDLEDADKWRPVDKHEAKKLWEEHVASVPEFRTLRETMLVGMILPIWDRLPATSTRVVRATTSEGERLIGRTLPARDLAETLKNLGLGVEVPAWAKDGAQAIVHIRQGAIIQFANGWKLIRARVENEPRVELDGSDWAHTAELKALGFFEEKIQWKTRWFMPTGADGAKVYEKLIGQRPIAEVIEGKIRSKQDEEQAKARQRAKLDARPKEELQELARQLGLSDRGDKGELVDQLLDAMPGDDVTDMIDPLDPFETMGAMAKPGLVITQRGKIKERIPTAAELAGAGATANPSKAAYPFKHGDEARYQAAHGIGRLTLAERLRDFWARATEDLARWTQRGSLPDLPRSELWGEARAVLLNIRKARAVSQFQAAKLFMQLEARLGGPKDVELFERSVLLDDLAETDGALPFGFTAETVQMEKEAIDAEVARNPAVQAAKQYRAEMWEAIKGDYSRAGKAVGWDVGKRLTRKNWYRHQVLHYFRLKQRLGADAYASGFPRPPQGAAIHTGRGFLKQRKGSELDINTHYLQAEWEALTAMREDTLRMKLQARLWKKHDILRKLKEQARAMNHAEALRKSIIEAGGDLDKGTKLYNKRFKGPIRAAMDAIGENIPEADIRRFAMPGQHPTAAIYAWAGWAARTLPEESRERQIALMLLGATARVKADMESYIGRLTTWEDLVPEDHIAVHPRPGRTVFWAWSIPEQLAHKISEAALQSSELMKVDTEDLRRVQAMGGEFTPVVVPKRLAAALDNLHPMLPSDLVDRAARLVITSWKKLKLFAPWNWPRYRFRNQTEIDKVFMVSPRATAKIPRAMVDLKALFSWKDNAPAEAREWLERGGAASMIRVVELGDVDAIEVLSKLTEPKKGGVLRIPLDLAKGFQRGIHTANDYLEGLYRYALYLDYLEQMQADPKGRPRNFGASVPKEVLSITDIRDRAYKLSNDAMGAYDDVSMVGDYLRRHVFPFWSFPELNFRAYTGFMRNLWRDPRVAGKLGAELFPALARSSPFLAMRLGRATLTMFGTTAILAAVNWLWGAGDDDDELPKDIQRRPHLTAPRWLTRKLFGDDAIYHFDRLGTSGDFLEWFGADALAYDTRDIITGRRSPREVAEDYIKSAPNKLVNLLSPHIKTPVEAISGRSLFPDAFKPRSIRDRWEYLADTVDAGAAYRALSGKPDKPAAAFYSKPFLYRTEADASSYYFIRDEVRRFKQAKGSGDFGGTTGGRSDALAYFKQALRFGDEDAAKRYLADYFALGGTRQGFKQSLERLDPLSGMNKDDRREFVLKYLREEDMDELARAQRYYADVLLGEPGQTERLMREAIMGLGEKP